MSNQYSKGFCIIPKRNKAIQDKSVEGNGCKPEIEFLFNKIYKKNFS